MEPPRFMTECIKKLNCLAVAIPLNQTNYIDACCTRYNTVVYISKLEVIGLRKISRYLIMSLFNKFLIKIGKPIILVKQLLCSKKTNTKRIQTPHLRSFLKVFQRESLKGRFRFYFLEFLNSDLLKQYLRYETKNPTEQVRLQNQITLFSKWMAQERFLVMLHYALKKYTQSSCQCFESYAFISGRVNEEYLFIETQNEY